MTHETKTPGQAAREAYERTIVLGRMRETNKHAWEAAAAAAISASRESGDLGYTFEGLLPSARESEASGDLCDWCGKHKARCNMSSPYCEDCEPLDPEPCCDGGGCSDRCYTPPAPTEDGTSEASEREHGRLLSPDKRAELANAEPDAARLAQMAGDMCMERKHFNSDTHQAFYDTLLRERAAVRASCQAEIERLKARFELFRNGVKRGWLHANEGRASMAANYLATLLKEYPE